MNFVSACDHNFNGRNAMFTGCTAEQYEERTK